MRPPPPSLLVTSSAAHLTLRTEKTWVCGTINLHSTIPVLKIFAGLLPERQMK